MPQPKEPNRAAPKPAARLIQWAWRGALPQVTHLARSLAAHSLQHTNSPARVRKRIRTACTSCERGGVPPLSKLIYPYKSPVPERRAKRHRRRGCDAADHAGRMLASCGSHPASAADSAASPEKITAGALGSQAKGRRFPKKKTRCKGGVAPDELLKRVPRRRAARARKKKLSCLPAMDSCRRHTA